MELIEGTGPSWLTFIGHTKDSLWSVDLFRCEAITLKLHWVLVVMDQSTRRIIGFAVHAGYPRWFTVFAFSANAGATAAIAGLWGWLTWREWKATHAA